MSRVAELVYRLMEILDGEKGVKLISYRIAQRVKLWLLNWIN